MSFGPSTCLDGPLDTAISLAPGAQAHAASRATAALPDTWVMPRLPGSLLASVDPAQAHRQLVVEVWTRHPMTGPRFRGHVESGRWQQQQQQRDGGAGRGRRHGGIRRGRGQRGWLPLQVWGWLPRAQNPKGRATKDSKAATKGSPPKANTDAPRDHPKRPLQELLHVRASPGALAWLAAATAAAGAASASA